MRALVTGGAGFIGSHLVDRLIADGHEVHVWDDFSTGRRSNLNENVQLTACDVTCVREYMLEETFDWIFHLAGLAALVASIVESVDYVDVNVRGTAEVLDYARRNGCQRLIYAASSSCYGANPPLPTDENAPIDCAHPYALSKRLGEEAALHWGRVYGLPVVSLRLFNVYGPRARMTGTYGAVMGTFLAQRANGAPLTVIGNGHQRRDFVWVEDVAEAFVLAAESDQTGVFNIGGDNPVSINRLAALIGGPIVRIPARGGEPAITHADYTKARRAFGWFPRVSIGEGVERLLANLDAFKNAPVWTPDTIAEATKTWHQHLG